MGIGKASIVVVDDEVDILDLIQYNLGREGYQLTCVENGEAALKEIRHKQPDMVLLDLMLPGIDGLEVCRILKATPDTSHIPIIMLTAKSEDVDIVTGLELGADDYLTKPFSPRVLLSRVKALLRRIQEQAKQGNNSLHRGNLSISLSQHEVRVGEISVDLTGTEFKILVTLAKRPGWVFTRDQIVLSSQGGNAIVTARSVDVHIVSLRRKLGTCGDYIETIRGIGYKFRIPPEQELPE